MRSARVVPQHSPQRAIRVRGGIGPESQPPTIGRVPQRVEDGARQYPRPSFAGVHGQNTVQIFGDVNYHGSIATLPSQAGSRAASQDGRLEAAANLHGRNNVFRGTRDHDTNGHLPVIRAIRRIQRAGAFIETNLPCERGRQRLLQFGQRDLSSFDPPPERIRANQVTDKCCRV